MKNFKRNIKIIFLLFILFHFCYSKAYTLGFDFKDFNFKKKKPVIEKTHIPETKADWLIESVDVPLSQRIIREVEEPKSDDKNYIPERRYIFEKYNYPQGSRKLNIEDIKKNLASYPIIIADVTCYQVAYVRYYFSPDINQISSEFYVGSLDTSKTKTDRILSYRHEQDVRYPIIEAGTKELYPYYFRGLSIIDWSADSKKILLKELSGSTLGGIYKSDIYVYFMDKQEAIKLDNFDEAVKKHFLNTKNLDLTNYRYEYEPLGFSAENDDIIIIHCYLFNKSGKRIFMGNWGYDLFDNKIILFSLTNPVSSVSSNGLVLRQVIN